MWHASYRTGREQLRKPVPRIAALLEPRSFICVRGRVAAKTNATNHAAFTIAVGLTGG